MTPDAAERRARALLDGHSLARDAAPDLARDVLSLADALRAAEAQRDAAQHTADTLGRSLTRAEAERVEGEEHLCAELRVAEARAVAAEARADAADARCAALAGAVAKEREARSEREAALRAERAARVADASADMAGWQVAHDRYTAARVAHERASTHLTALLRGAPGGYVPVRVVASYKAAVERIADLDDDSPESVAAFRAARTALAAALLAATTTPEESL